MSSHDTYAKPDRHQAHCTLGCSIESPSEILYIFIFLSGAKVNRFRKNLVVSLCNCIFSKTYFTKKLDKSQIVNTTPKPVISVV